MATTVKEAFGLSTHAHPPILNTREFACGCEFEIEDIKDDDNVQAAGKFIIDVDHSLRNNGKEYKTSPNTFETTLELFEELHDNLAVGKEPFSDRTSIHVHVNVRMLELAEIRQLVLTYALLEPLFFEFVGNTRKNSIFCVPLNYTYIPSMYKSPIGDLHKKWHKYTAFNIVPLGSHPSGGAPLGTVEFRHLYGTKDLALFTKWLSAIKELYTFIATTPGFDVLKQLEEGVDVVALANTIVPSLTTNMSGHHILELLEDSTLDVKLAAGGLKNTKGE